MLRKIVLLCKSMGSGGGIKAQQRLVSQLPPKIRNVAPICRSKSNKDILCPPISLPQLLSLGL
jgi:hypothetical protein